MPEQVVTAVVLFDAVGTVIKPDPGVVTVYEQLGRTHGCSLSRDELKLRINQARQKYFNVVPAADADLAQIESETDKLVSSDEIELQLWRELVVEVFKEIPDANRLFDELWEHFRLPQHWRLYDDVASCWDRLRAYGCLIGLASNFDSRLLQLCEAIPLLKTADFVFQSAGVGFRKPSPQFYSTIEKEVGESLRESSVTSNLTSFDIYMVGDDLVNDCLGPNRAGWTGFWLNRSHQPAKTSRQSSDPQHAFEQVASLIEFVERVAA